MAVKYQEPYYIRDMNKRRRLDSEGAQVDESVAQAPHGQNSNPTALSAQTVPPLAPPPPLPELPQFPTPCQSFPQMQQFRQAPHPCPPSPTRVFCGTVPNTSFPFQGYAALPTTHVQCPMPPMPPPPPLPVLPPSLMPSQPFPQSSNFSYNSLPPPPLPLPVPTHHYTLPHPTFPYPMQLAPFLQAMPPGPQLPPSLPVLTPPLTPPEPSCLNKSQQVQTRLPQNSPPSPPNCFLPNTPPSSSPEMTVIKREASPSMLSTCTTPAMGFACEEETGENSAPATAGINREASPSTFSTCPTPLVNFAYEEETPKSDATMGFACEEETCENSAPAVMSTVLPPASPCESINNIHLVGDIPVSIKEESEEMDKDIEETEEEEEMKEVEEKGAEDPLALVKKEKKPSYLSLQNVKKEDDESSVSTAHDTQEEEEGGGEQEEDKAVNGEAEESSASNPPEENKRGKGCEQTASPWTPVKEDTSAERPASNCCRGTSEVCLVPAALLQRQPDTHTPSLKTFNKRDLDDLLLKMIINDFNSFDIVEKGGFRAFTKGLNPNYDLPSRKMILESLIPALYNQCLSHVKAVLTTIKSVSISTETWASVNDEWFLNITAHFVTNGFELKSLLLACCPLQGRPNTDNLSKALFETIRKYNLRNKISLALSGDTASHLDDVCTEAYRNCQLKYYGCFAHTINMIVKDALVFVDDVIKKVRRIVLSVKQSPEACEKVERFPKSCGCHHYKELILDVPSRWLSTLHMLERFMELKEAVQSAMDSSIPWLNEMELKTVNETCQILKFLETELAAVKDGGYALGSWVMVLASTLDSHYQKLQVGHLTEFSKNVVQVLRRGMREKFRGVEDSGTFRLCTMLDPRFKDFYFIEPPKRSDIILKLESVLSFKITGTNPGSPGSSVAFSTGGLCDLIAAKKEVNRYRDCGGLTRDGDPLKWWKERRVEFPHLSEIAQEVLCVVGTALPCENIFSDKGLIFNDKRARLRGSEAEQILFLNSNRSI